MADSRFLLSPTKRIRMRSTPAFAALALLCVLALSALGGQVPAARAIELPPPGSPIFIQTNGPTSQIGLGDWYTNADNGVGPGYHYFSIIVPCAWPAAGAFQIDLFSPEINTSQPRPRLDETTGSLDETVFELYGPFAPRAAPREPTPGAAGSVFQRTFAPVAATAERWERFYTIAAPVACGAYILRAETKNNDQNGWRLRIGLDDDADPNNAPPPNYDNPDGLAGTGDEAQFAIARTTYQHNAPTVQCLTLYQFVEPGSPTARFHNFDLDNNERVTYYPPSAQYDSQGALTPGAIAGTLSGNAVWNNGTQTDRGAGDLVNQPEPGLWRIVTCVRGDNQFNQEGITDQYSTLQPPPQPDMVVAKDDGRTVVGPGDTLAYAITFTNQAATTRTLPGAALAVQLTDTLPPNTTYVGCRIVTPGLAGSCAQSGGVVTFSLTNPVAVGASGAVEVTVRVNAGATGQVVNTVALDYQDLFGNQYPTVRDDDVDTIPAGSAPSVSATKVARIKLDRNGDGRAGPTDVIEYTIVVSNTGNAAAFDVTVGDPLSQYTTLVVGSVRAEPGGTVLAGNTSGDTAVSARFGLLAAGAAVRVLMDVTVNTGIPNTVQVILNQGTITHTGSGPICTDYPVTPGSCEQTPVIYQPPGGGPPTAIELLDLGAQRRGAAVELRWATGAEVGTAGFHLYRATSADRAAATRVTPALIPARGGPSGGASYRWVDAAPPAGSVFYWLVEVEAGGATREHGPVRPSAPAPASSTRLFLPLLRR